MPRLDFVIKNFEDLDRTLKKILIGLRVLLALSIVGFSPLAITFGVANKLKSELHFFFLPAAFIGALVGILLTCFYCYNQISSIQEKIASISEILQSEEANTGSLKVAIYETVREACDEVYKSAITVVRVLFFTPGVLTTTIGIILIIVATVNVVNLRIITFTTGCLFIGVGICGMIFIIIGYKYLVRYLRLLHSQLDGWLSEEAALMYP